MPASEIKSLFGTITAMTITVAAMATSNGTVGQQSTLVDNTVTRYSKVKVSVKIKLGTSPTSNRCVYLYLIRGDGTLTDDNAGATNAALTVKNCTSLGCLQTGSAAATGDVLTGTFEINEPGRIWGIAIAHDTGVNLDGTGGNHLVEYYGINPEAQ